MPPDDGEAPRGRKRQIDWDALPRFEGPADGSVNHDEILYKGWLREQREAKRSQK